MGDVPIAYVEGAGGTRVSEDEIVAVGKYDVSASKFLSMILIAHSNFRYYHLELAGSQNWLYTKRQRKKYPSYTQIFDTNQP